MTGFGLKRESGFQGLGGIPPPKALGISPKKFQNAVLFLRFGVPSSLIRHENGAFHKTLFDSEEFHNEGFSF